MKNMKKGFTLVELLVVIAIIGLLATLALVSIGGVRVRARDARTVADVSQIRNALELHSTQVGTYPVHAVAAFLPIGIAASTNILCSVGGFVSACAAPGATAFMSSVPRNSAKGTLATDNCFGKPVATGAPCDYAYASNAGGTNYAIQFGSEGDPDGNGPLATGLNCASPAGLVAGACAAP